MAEQSTQSLTIDAPAAQVMAVIADFADYPSWARSVTSADVVEEYDDGYARQVRFVLNTAAIKDEYTLSYDWADDLSSVGWQLVAPSSVQKSQRGSYVLAERGGSTTVTYSLTVEMTIPMLGLLRRKAEKMIMDTALKELKKRVER